MNKEKKTTEATNQTASNKMKTKERGKFKKIQPDQRQTKNKTPISNRKKKKRNKIKPTMNQKR